MRKPAKSFVVPLLAALALLFAACSPTVNDPGSLGGGNGGEEQQDSGPPSANFRIGDLRVIDSQDRPEASSKAEPENARVLALVNNYYNAAFLDPDKWTDGTHQVLADYFTEGAKGQVGPRIGVLALGDLARSLDNVRVDSEQITRLTYYFDNDLNAPYGIVTTSFEGTATPKAEDSPPIKIKHSGTFWIQREGEDYRINAFNADIDEMSEA